MVVLHEKFSGHPTHGVEGVVGVGMRGAFKIVIYDNMIIISAFSQTADQYKSNRR